MKLFLLGLPGSGKSTAAGWAQVIVRDHKDKGWSIFRINDYDILYDMFQKDSNHEKFRSIEHGGFDILDLTVFDLALKELEKQVRNHIIQTPNAKQLILIEFARDNYKEALKQFSSDFLQDAYFLFLDADIQTCKQRIDQRVANPLTPDDHFVSEYIFEVYYDKDNRQYVSSSLITDFGINAERVQVIDNTGSWQNLTEKVTQFVNFIFSQQEAFNLAPSGR